MVYILAATAAIIALALGWAWWAGRIGRDPSSTVDHFNRARQAMERGSGGGSESKTVRRDEAAGPDDS